MELEIVVKQRQALKDEIDALEAELKALNGKIAGALEEEGLTKLNVGYWTVSAQRTKRFKPAIAAQLMEKKRLSKANCEKLYKAREYDADKLKVMFPEVWNEARVEDQKATVVVREVKP